MCGDRYRLFACIETLKTWPLRSFAHYRYQDYDSYDYSYEYLPNISLCITGRDAA